MNPESTQDSFILIPFGDSFLAVTPNEIKTAKERARAIMGDAPGPTSNGNHGPEIVGAEEAEKLTSIPASWYLEQARKNRIPHLRFGKYVRFKLKDIIEHVERSAKQKAKAGFPR
jgi:hypothetical protein